MAKAKTYDPQPLMGGIGEIDPGTRKAGIIALRIAAGASLLVLLAGFRPANQGMRWAGLHLHSGAGQLADKMLHQHTYRPVRDLVPHHRDIIDPQLRWLVYTALAMVAVYLLLGVAKLRRPGAAKADGRRNVVGIVAAVVVGLALLVVGALQVAAGREVVALTLRALAGFGSAIDAAAVRLWER